MSAGSRGRATKGPERPFVVGFVCEGSTDVLILRSITEQVLGPVEAITLQPETDELDRQKPGTRSGWTEVKAWCERLEDFSDCLSPGVGEPLDLLVVAIDLDIAIKAGVTKPPANLGAYDASALCDVVKTWLPKPLPPNLVITVPVMSIEAWVLAALFPRRKNLEAEASPAEVLVQAKKIPRGKKGPWKRAREFEPFGDRVAAKLDRVQKSCGEAKRFVQKLERFRDRARL